jgi:hypothetical protein
MSAVPHQAWAKEGGEPAVAGRQTAPSETAGLTVLSSEELRLASLKKEQEPVAEQPSAGKAGLHPVSGTSGATDVESRLVSVMKDMRQETSLFP